MSPIDLAPPAVIAPEPKLWKPAAPYIVRASEDDLRAVKAMPFLCAVAGGARRVTGGIALTSINSFYNDADQTTYDFGNFYAPTDGLMIVGVVGRNSAATARTINAVSIGGVNGTIHTSTGNNVNHAGIASRVVTAGNNNVTVTMSGGTNRLGGYVWLLTGYTSATPADATSNASTSASNRSTTFNLPARSVSVWVSFTGASGSTAWSTATKRYDNFADGTETRVSAADYYSANAVTGHTETATFGGSSVCAIAGAVWE